MTVDLRGIAKLKEQVASLQRDADKAAGALEQTLGRLRDEFGCATVEAAEALLGELRAAADAAEEKYTRALRKFEEKWGDVLK